MIMHRWQVLVKWKVLPFTFYSNTQISAMWQVTKIMASREREEERDMLFDEKVEDAANKNIDSDDYVY